MIKTIKQLLGIKPKSNPDVDYLYTEFMQHLNNIRTHSRDYQLVRKAAKMRIRVRQYATNHNINISDNE